MNDDKLATMLRASRHDLVDGFACKAVVKALSLPDDHHRKLKRINELLQVDNVSVVLCDEPERMLDGFREVGLAGATTYTDGAIEIKLTPTFFTKEPSQSVLKRALRFQSLIAHELVHRNQYQQKAAYGQTTRSEKTADASSEEYLNDSLEIDAMAAEISHDMRAKHIIGGEQLFDISPRLKALLENARLLGAGTIDVLYDSMKTYA
jgi:hypothetical protein